MMDSRLRVMEWGALSLLAVSVCLMLVLGTEGWPSIIGNWVYKWQTLISAGIALLGALITVRRIRQQIEQVDKHNQEEISRKHNAARAALPLTLSSIDSFCKVAAQRLASQISVRENFKEACLEVEASTEKSDRLAPISLDEKVTSDLKEFVGTLRGRKSVRHVAELMGSIQILKSRFNDFDLNRGDEFVRIGLLGLLLDIAKVRMLNQCMYEYGRFVGEGFAIVGRIDHDDAWNRILAAAYSLIRESRCDEARELLKSIVSTRIAEKKSPWLRKFDGLNT